MKNRNVQLCGTAWVHPEIPFCPQTGRLLWQSIDSTTIVHTYYDLHSGGDLPDYTTIPRMKIPPMQNGALFSKKLRIRLKDDVHPFDCYTFDCCQSLLIMKDKPPHFQGLKNCKLIFFGFIEQIFIFHGRFAAFKTNFKHICWIEMSTDKK